MAAERHRTDRLRDVLNATGFTGDLETSLGAREVASTDNSIYQQRPAAIAYPREAADVNRVVRAAASVAMPIIARGGNTGTNGQSLGTGLVVDFARHMTAIIRLAPSALRVEVEPGVVLGQLNDALRPQGLFFPPMVSTANRATLGGMVATDASGKGSRHYGKTSDYIESLDLVLADGSDWRAEPMTHREAERIAAGDGLIANIHREALRIVDTHAAEIARVFPRINRGLTGYNLQKLYDAEADRFSLGYLLAGSEGTLALTRGITLRVAPRPTHRCLVVIRYESFASGLAHVSALLNADPVAVEILDDKILGAASDDIIWANIGAILGGQRTGRAIGAMNFVEFSGFDPAELERGLARLTAVLGEGWTGMVDWTLVREAAEIGRLWTLREKAVGLLGRLGQDRQGVPFVEDTAVPPENLVDYVGQFRALLDRHGLSYGMFGHADVGCLHVRPFLDMKDPAQAALIRPISDAVAALTKSHGGLLWGEHGRGYRGEYSPFFFGPTLYPEVEAIKRAFDPANRLNPGKLASPDGEAALDRIDHVPLRGEHDRRISAALASEFDRAIACNGNGACFSWDATDIMCPSYKATHDRAQSPKGRAALIRAWARLARQDKTEEFSQVEQALAASLSTCLACKACTSQCPVRVDVPTMTSRFWEHYYRRHRRPLTHYALRFMEPALLLARQFPALANMLAASGPMRKMLQRWLGMEDLPIFSPTAQHLALPVATPLALAGLSAVERARTLVLIEDSFTASFDAAVPRAAADVLAGLGYRLYRLPVRANGKLLHLLGWRDAFARIARARASEAAALTETGVRLVSLDAATGLMYEQEYREAAPHSPCVATIDDILAKDIVAGRLGKAASAQAGSPLRLLGHCTEQALRPEALQQWQHVFAHFGVTATPAPTGCCGMAGVFGHQVRNRAMSQRLFDLSWRTAVEESPDNVVATGFSCRSQAHRMTQHRPPHPVEVLAAII